MKKYISTMFLAGTLMLGSIFLLGGCGKSTPEKVVTNELDLIQKLDEDTISSFVSYEDMMRGESENSSIEVETTKAVKLFFKNFSYKIEDVDTREKSATVQAKITNINAKELAHDLCMSLLHKTLGILPDQEVPANMNDYFSLLDDILSENSYDLVTTEATFELAEAQTGWVIQETDTLEDQLVGGFITYLNDPELITPDEVTLTVFEDLDTLTPEQWIDYLDMADIFKTGSQLAAQIDLALATRIADSFSYEIGEAQVNSSQGTAVIPVTITSLNMPAVMKVYRESLTQYASSTESIRASDEDVANKAGQLLLDALDTQTDTLQSQIQMELTNDGTGWEIVLDETYTNALLGNLEDGVATFIN